MRFTLPILALFLLISTNSLSGQVESDGEIRLQNLVTGHPIIKKSRFRVVDIKVDKTSVKDLFLPVDGENQGLGSYFGRREVVTLKVNDKRVLSKLRSLLLSQEKPHLSLFLEDTGPIASFYKMFSPIIFTKLEISTAMEVPLTIDITPCERITRIVYRSIDSILSREISRAGQTQGSVTLDQVFDMLLRDKLEPYLETLTPSERSNPCFNTFNLLKWLRNQEAHGFEFAEYRLNQGLKAVLLSVTDSLYKIRNWRRHNLQIDIIGYTDSVPFERRPYLWLRADATGIDNLHDPLSIYYAGCAKDRITGDYPVFISLDTPTGNPIGEQINDNCELGATRAYVTAAFLIKGLGRENVKYKYATGGVSDSTLERKDDALKRKVGARITVKAADEQ